MQLVLATRNPHKLREFRELFAGHEIVELPPEFELPPESGQTFAENALAKALTAAAATQVPAIADDSGIEVAALGGAPGTLSARYAGAGASDERNLARLIAATEATTDRRAAYVCALAIAWPDGRGELVEGRCEGLLARDPTGSGGFGYDPIFLPDDIEDDRTMAELEQAEKDAISHRGRAARAMLNLLVQDSEQIDSGGDSDRQ